MRQTTLFEPQTLDATICAIEQRGWYLLSSADDVTTWERRGVERVLAAGYLAAWLAAGTPEKADASAYDVEQVIRREGPITRRVLMLALKTRYQVGDLGAMLQELIREGWVEETPDGFIGVDRI